MMQSGMCIYEKNELKIKKKDEPVIRNSFAKLLHAFLLEHFSSEVLYEFYKKHENVAVAPSNNAEQIIIHLWNENQLTAAAYVNYLLKSIELLCIDHAMPMYESFNDFLISAIVSKAKINQIHNTLLHLLMRENAFRKLLLHSVYYMSSSLCPDAICTIISKSEYPNCSECRFLIKQCNGYNSDNCVVGIEIFAYLSMALPVTFCSTPFSKYQILAHEQKIQELLWDDEVIYYKDGKLYINGEIHGVQTSIEEEGLRNRLHELGLCEPGELRGTMITREYICPRRKRVILRRKEIYDAPFSVVSVFDTVQSRKIGRYDAIIQDDRDVTFWNDLEKKQNELLREFKKTNSFIFDKSMQIIIINDSLVISGVQAKILSSILKSYIDNKREVFEWRDLAANDEFICDPYSTGLSTRLNRLITLLKKNSCGCIIDKINRGKYKLTLNGNISYFER